jgi:hypothetical protein
MLILITLISFSLKANEVKVDFDKKTGSYIFHMDAPSGKFSKSTLPNKSLKEASFIITFSDIKDRPAGAQFSFYNDNKESGFYVSFQLGSNTDKHVIFALVNVHNNNLISSDDFRVPVSSLKEITINFKWSNNQVSMVFNSDKEVINIPLLFKVDELELGFLSAKGEIRVSLPNKSIK